MYLFPQLVPKTMEQLTLRADDEEALKQQEAAYEAKARSTAATVIASSAERAMLSHASCY